ncbi:MAG: hypothetical protein JO089_08655, partial [Alphaproteobacteria bacterium]|nr:hypothetical protein [Alphaproteobacteria bacterium]
MADNSRSVPSLEEKIIQQKVIRADPRKAQAVMQDLITIFKEDKDPAERKILKDTQRALEAFTRNSIANQKLFAAYMDAIQS